MIASILPALVVAVVGGLILAWFAKGQKTKDELSAAQVSRVYSLEQWQQRHTEEDTATRIALVRLEEWKQGAQETLVEIKEHMVRREDLEALSQRIDDALRRPSNPPPRRR